MVLFMAGLELY